MQAPNEFLNQFGILNGQTIELHWNVLNADWISIDGVGFVQAIGKKEFYPSSNTKYKLTAKNRNHAVEQEFFVRVFPIPVMEKLKVPMPDITSNNIHLFTTPIRVIEKPISANFPSFQLPSVIEIGKKNTTEKPSKILLNIGEVPLRRMAERNDNTREYRSFKTNLFNTMENTFRDNYKVKDIIQTIRKHYE